MKLLIKSLFFVVTALLFVQCGSDKFKISKGQVGLLTKETIIKDLDEIFKNDSIVKNLSEGVKGDNYFQDDDEYKIYDKHGKHLLTITPKEQLDATSTIKSIEIFDKRFKTETGINVNSTFQQINANDKISSIETSISSATLFIDNLNATFTIDKEDLGLKDFSSAQKISIEQIPDLAKVKSFTVWFN